MNRIYIIIMVFVISPLAADQGECCAWTGEYVWGYQTSWNTGQYCCIEDSIFGCVDDGTIGCNGYVCDDPGGTISPGWNDCYDYVWDPNAGDCSAVLGCDDTCGSGFQFDDCGICGGNGSSCGDCDGNNGYINTNADCDGQCTGASIDACGICSGGGTGNVPNINLDCNDTCYGTAFIDDCGVCSGGTSGHQANSDIDDCGQCFGFNQSKDDCGVCGGNGSSCGDCDGKNGIITLLDDCGNCGQNNSAKDCCGVCYGDGTSCVAFGAILADCSGVCGGNLIEDCSGVCAGNAYIDNCGSCVGGTTGNSACVEDCLGNWGGTAQIDCFGVCDGGSVEDCSGVCGGTAALDDCGICNGENSDKDCSGTCFGSAIIDDCGICGGENLAKDCSGTCFGSATNDDCGVCNGTGSSCSDCDGINGVINLIDDCGICGGNNATLDDCGVCDGNNSTCLYDTICGNNCLIVPTDYATIQSAINAADHGDTVLVEEGIYYENLIIQKNIVLISTVALELSETGFLANWSANIDGESVVVNSRVLNTIIDGGNTTLGPSFQSVILVDNIHENDCLQAKIIGFTIRNGRGTSVQTLEGVQVEGGGLFSNNSRPVLNYNYFLDNKGAPNRLVNCGGGVATSHSNIFPSSIDGFQFGTGSNCNQLRSKFKLRNNFFRRNDAKKANSVSTCRNISGSSNSNNSENDSRSDAFSSEIDLSNSNFDVIDCEKQTITESWVDVDQNIDVDFSNINGKECARVVDVYVDPTENGNGNDENNLGTSPSSPFKTIKRALEAVAIRPDNPVTINLLPGTFSVATNNEELPIDFPSNIKLIGSGEEISIIKGQSEGDWYSLGGEEKQILRYFSRNNILIAHLTVANGYNPRGEGHRGGGGMEFNSSTNIIISDVTLRDNKAIFGGAIHLENSDVMFSNLTIYNNYAHHKAGAINVNDKSSLIAKNLLIYNNTANFVAGGMRFNYIKESKPTTIINSTITNNTCNDPGNIYNHAFNGYGGGISVSSSYPIIKNSIIWGNEASDGDDNITISDAYQMSTGNPIITYSNIEGGFSGVGNKNVNPLFNADYSLQLGSGCINSGEIDEWNTDLEDGSRADMGAFGGSYIITNFTEYNFGEVGNIISNAPFRLYNYSNHDYNISSVEFSSNDFSTSSNFSMEIPNLSESEIVLQAEPLSLGFIQGQMKVNSSSSFLDNLTIQLSVTGSEGAILGGSLQDSEVIEKETYLVSSDLIIDVGNTVTIMPGTKLLFYPGCKLIVNGTLKAEGTVNDSIIFDTYDTSNKWQGIELNNVTNQTRFTFTRISRSYRTSGRGGGFQMNGSNPIIKNTVISSNYASAGGGVAIMGSEPIFQNVIISGNNSYNDGGGFYLGGQGNIYQASFINTTITENWCNANSWGGVSSHAGFVGGGADETWFINSIIYNNGGVNSNQIMNWANFHAYNTLFGHSFPESNDDSGNNPHGQNHLLGSPSFSNSNYDLTYDSQCTDAGTTNLYGILPNIEFYIGDAPDIGAREYGCSSNVYDDCGVCGGNGSSCGDCDGVINSIVSIMDDCGICGGNGASKDDCGVCGGNGSSCGDCDGVINSIVSIMDDCGVCGGNGSICNDCDGINGLITLVDDCGVCGGNNASVDDCGVCNGNGIECNDCDGTNGLITLVDDCNICGGNNASLDDCGVCNGNGFSCNDCDGSNNGVITLLDVCGVCGGDASCIGCMNQTAYNYESTATIEGLCINYGDANMDGGIDVIDVILIISHIVNDILEDLNEDQINISDLNTDELINIIDVIMVVDLILEDNLSRGRIATTTTFYYGNGMLTFKADGKIAGIQLEVSGDYDIHTINLPNGWEIANNNNIIIMYSLDGSSLNDKLLFLYNGDFIIESVIVADWHESMINIESILIPREFNLFSAYPNPFNPITTLEFALPKEIEVSIVIFDMQGRKVATLTDGLMGAGYHSINWNARDESSGIYFVQMISGEFMKTQKLMLLK